MKTTKKDFELFKKECEKWIKKLGLDNKRVTIYWSDLEPETAACIYRDLLQASVEIHLCKDYESHTLTDEKIKGHAKHEVIHLLLADLSVYAGSRYVTQQELQKSEEELVRKLEKLL